jgi:hypothetical protein
MYVTALFEHSVEENWGDTVPSVSAELYRKTGRSRPDPCDNESAGNHDADDKGALPGNLLHIDQLNPLAQ